MISDINILTGSLTCKELQRHLLMKYQMFSHIGFFPPFRMKKKKLKWGHKLAVNFSFNCLLFFMQYCCSTDEKSDTEYMAMNIYIVLTSVVSGHIWTDKEGRMG